MNIHRCRFVDYTPHTITATAFSHSSSLLKVETDLRLAVGRSNGDIEIWSPKSNWTHEITLPGSRGRSIEGLCWASTENPRLFSIGGSTYITEWDLSTGRPVANYDCNAGTIWSIDINANNDKLTVGCDDGSVVIVDISGGFASLEHNLICQRQDARVLSIKWNGNSSLVGGCADGRIRIWSAAGQTKGRIMATMRVDKSKTESTLVWSICILPKKRQIVSGDSTGAIKFWDLDHHSLLQSFSIHDADVLSLVADISEEKVFTAGVDRKIHQFSLITSKTTSKWVHNCNRLLHSNDIRSMSIYESKGYNFLVSGGVERSIVIQSVNSFHDGKYKKLSINQQKSNIVINELHKLLILWQDQTIKIWKIIDGKHKLISKLTLAEDENITGVDINTDATLLVVSRITSVKVFELTHIKNNKIQVKKYRDEKFDEIIEGAKNVKLYSDNKLLILTPNEEIYKFNINKDDQEIVYDDEIELLSSSSKSKLSYNQVINNICISPDEKSMVLSRFNGSIEKYSLVDDYKPYQLVKLSSYPNIIKFFGNDKLIVLTSENKLYEFLIDEKNKSSLLSPWSRRNSEFLPHQFLTLEDKPQDLFLQDKKVWIYGSTWIVYFDLTMNIPISKYYKNTSNSKKRTRDGLTIDEDLEDNMEEEQEDQVEILELALKQSQINKLRQQIQDDEVQSNGAPSSNDKRPFWLGTKYRPILKAGNFAEGEIIVIERPQFSLPTTPAFNLPKLKV